MDPDLADLVAGFGEYLHLAGVPVTVERQCRFAGVVALVQPDTMRQLYWLARTTLVSDRDQIPTFDAVFDHVFGSFADVATSRGDPAAPALHARRRDPQQRSDHSGPSGRGAGAQPGTAGGGADSERQDADGVEVLVDVAERLGGKDFGSCTPDELDELARLIAALGMSLPTRLGRRTTRASRGERFDLRTTARRSHRTGGDPVRTVRRRRRTQPRRLVLVADVSGSMETYSRAYLYLLHAAVRAVRAEAFVFATALTHLSPALRISSPEVALRRATSAATDWSGGTRLGECLAMFVDHWGRRGLARGAVVVIVSDGWDGGDPELVATQMERLARLAHRIVWVNPRAQSPRYEPLVRSMRAALPHIDQMCSGHSLDALDEVLESLGGGVHTRVTRR